MHTQSKYLLLFYALHPSPLSGNPCLLFSVPPPPPLTLKETGAGQEAGEPAAASKGTTTGAGEDLFASDGDGSDSDGGDAPSQPRAEEPAARSRAV